MLVVGLVAEDNPAAVLPPLQAVMHARPSLSAEILFGPLVFVIRALGHCASLRQEPLAGFGRAVTALMLALGLDELWGSALLRALRESGARWPGSAMLRSVATDELRVCVALATNAREVRTDILLPYLAREEWPTTITWVVEYARQLGPWSEAELQRLLGIQAIENPNLGSLGTSAQSFHVAAALSLVDGGTSALSFLDAGLYAREPERRAYSALALLRAGRFSPEVLATLRSALEHDIWRGYVPAPTRSKLRELVDALPRSLSQPALTEVERILSEAPARLLHPSTRSLSPASPSDSAPDRYLREALALQPDDTLSEALAVARVRQLPVWSILSAVRLMAGDVRFTDASWRPLTREMLGRITDPYERTVLAALLDDRDELRHWANDPDAEYPVPSAAQRALTVADALDAVLQIGTLRRGIVSLAGRRIGTLTELPGHRTRFTYDAPYIEEPTARPLSPTLPLRPEPYDSDGLHPYFAGLLPQGSLLEAKGRAQRLHSSDQFGILLALGPDMPGAVQVATPAGAGP